MRVWVQRCTVLGLACWASAAAGVFAGCKGAGSGGQAMESAPATADRVAPGANPTVGNPTAATGAAAQGADATSQELAPEARDGAQRASLQIAAELRRFQLALPARAPFVSQPLPPEDPARARSFEE